MSKTVTLQTAVLMQVKEFASKQTTFSLHDITRSIRENTSNGGLEIPEVEVHGASFHFDIPHAKVRGIFEELWRNGVFDIDFKLNRQHNGTYFEYVAVGTPSVPAPAAVSLKPTNAPIYYPTLVDSKIKNYLENCKGKTKSPTMKEIQSSLKVKGYTCEQISNTVKKLGYAITEVPSHPSLGYISF